jgi:hypothetical protein
MCAAVCFVNDDQCRRVHSQHSRFRISIATIKALHLHACVDIQFGNMKMRRHILCLL